MIGWPTKFPSAGRGAPGLPACTCIVAVEISLARGGSRQVSERIEWKFRICLLCCTIRLTPGRVAEEGEGSGKKDWFGNSTSGARCTSLPFRVRESLV